MELSNNLKNRIISAVTNNGKEYVISLILFAIVLFNLFAVIPRTVHTERYVVSSNQKIFTQLINPYIKKITITNFCELAGESKLVIGSFYDGPNYILEINNLKNQLNCEQNKIIQQNRKIIAEYIEFNSSDDNKIDLIIESETTRQISYLKIILNIIIFLIYLSYIIKLNRKIVVTKFEIVTIGILITFGLINLLLIIPNWDDGWQFAIINNWIEFGTANNLWAKYNGIFGNWLYSILSFIYFYVPSVHLLRLLTLLVWILTYLVTIKILKNHYEKNYNLENRILIFLIYSFIIISVGNTLRFEPYICLFTMYSIYSLLNFIKSKDDRELNKLLLFSSLSLSLGFAGFLVLGLLVIVLSKIKLHQIILFFNFLLLTANLFLVNSNLKLILEDITATRILTLRSHSFGVLDEWRRYFSENGIINSYDFSFSIFFVILTFSILIISIKLIRKDSKFETLNLIFIFMIIILSFTPSKWGWYLLPILPVATLIIIFNLDSEYSRLFTLFSFGISILVAIKLNQNTIWKPNPSIDNNLINYELAIKPKLLHFFTLSLIIFTFLLLFMLKKKNYRNPKTVFLGFLTFGLITILIKPIPFFHENDSTEKFTWYKNSFNKCGLIDKLEFNKIIAPLNSNSYIVSNGLEYPNEQQEVFINGLKRYTTNINDQFKLDLKINPIQVNSNVAFAIRGKDIEKVDIRVKYFDQKDLKEIEIAFNNLADSSIWQQYIFEESNLSNMEVQFFSDTALSDIQITSPYYVQKSNLLTFLKSSSMYLHLGPQEALLGSCLNAPLFVGGKWVVPNLVIGNANNLLNVFKTDDYLKIINSCWGNQNEIDIGNCIVEWHAKSI